MRKTPKRQPQPLRLSKESRFDIDQVEIFREGDETVLRNNPRSLLGAFRLLAEVEGEFQREQLPMQERDFSLSPERNPCETI